MREDNLVELTKKELLDENRSLHGTLRYVSHELLNVLTLVNYSVQAVNVSEESIKENKYWNYIVDDVDYMIKLLRELSEYNHSGEISKMPLDLTKMISSLVDEMSLKYGHIANIKIKSSQNPYIVMCDGIKIRQVIINIVKNAVEAMEKKEEKGNIIIHLKKLKKWITIKIEDDGCGIDEKIVEKIFEEGVTMGKEEGSGSGLGLAISKKIIESHGGMLSVKSELDKGSMFVIKIPC